jgi:hypothetical protein
LEARVVAAGARVAEEVEPEVSSEEEEEEEEEAGEETSAH